MAVSTMSTNFSAARDQRAFHFASLCPTFIGYSASITSTQAFRIIYGDGRGEHFNHFKANKDPLPLLSVLRNTNLVNELQVLEPGMQIDYDALRDEINELKPTFARSSRRLFAQLDQFLGLYDAYVYHTTQFINYDLYHNVLRAYYEPRGDVALLNLMPAQSMMGYAAEVVAYDEPARRQAHADQWRFFLDNAVSATTAFILSKASFNTIDAFWQIDHLQGVVARQAAEGRARRIREQEVMAARLVAAAGARALAMESRRSGELERTGVPQDVAGAAPEGVAEEHQENLGGTAVGDTVEEESRRAEEQ